MFCTEFVSKVLTLYLYQVGANDYAEADASDEKTAEDMRWLAELGAKQNPPVKVAYEVWCFSKRVNTWEHAWKIVQLGVGDVQNAMQPALTNLKSYQDHPNLGLCLDVAHFPLAPSYGWDPTTGEGWSDCQYNEMISRLKKVPGNKIFYLEISDVLKPVRPLGRGSPFDAWRERNRPARGDIFVWTVCGRPLPFVGKDAGRSVDNEDDMGGARVFESVQAVLSTGFKGVFFYQRMTKDCWLTSFRTHHMGVLRSHVNGER